MGILNLLGLDELADGLNELTSGFDELKSEFIDSVIGPSDELKNTIGDIAGAITNPTEDPAE